VDSLKLASFGNFGGRSAIIHRTVRCAKRSNSSKRQRSSTTLQWYSARLHAQKSEQVQKAHRIVNRTCPVHHQTVWWPTCQKLQWSNPNGLVTWLAHRTVRCAIRQKPSPTVNLVVGAINTPNHHTSMHTRALDFIQRHKQRDQILSQVQRSFQSNSD
jgi:hypothetical protein